MKTLLALLLFASAIRASSVTDLTATLCDETKAFDVRFGAATALVKYHPDDPATFRALVKSISMRSPHVPKIAINASVDAGMIFPISKLLTKLDPTLLPQLINEYAAEPDDHKRALFGLALIDYTRGNADPLGVWNKAIATARDPEKAGRLTQFAREILLLRDIAGPIETTK